MPALGEESGGELLHMRIPCLEESSEARDTGRAGSHCEQFGSALRQTRAVHLRVTEKLIHFFAHERGSKAAQLADERLERGRRGVAVDCRLDPEGIQKPVEFVNYLSHMTDIAKRFG